MVSRQTVHILLSLCILPVVAAFANTVPQAETAPFTIVVLPDTQKYVRYGAPEEQSAIFTQQTTWIRDHAASDTIVFVTHQGDVVDTGAEYSVEWERADTAMDVLDGVVPYAIVHGNHDFDDAGHRSSGTDTYLRYFGPQRFQGYTWYGGASNNGLNSYQLFQANGWTFLHLALELEIPNTAIAWAQTVIDAHPGMPTIITTHAYQRDDTGRTTSNEFGGNTGQQIWDKLIKNNSQIFLVLNGHFTRTDGERHQVSTNSAGLPVYEIVADYQDYPNGGNGYLRLLQFDPAAGELRVQSYSPFLDQFMTDGDSAFQFQFDFNNRFGAPNMSTALPTEQTPRASTALPTPTSEAGTWTPATPTTTTTAAPTPELPIIIPMPRPYTNWLPLVAP